MPRLAAAAAALPAREVDSAARTEPVDPTGSALRRYGCLQLRPRRVALASDDEHQPVVCTRVEVELVSARARGVLQGAAVTKRRSGADDGAQVACGLVGAAPDRERVARSGGEAGASVTVDDDGVAG